MHTVSLFDAKTNLSKLVESLIEGTEDEVVISRHGRAVVRMTPLPRGDVSKRLGIAKGRFVVPDDIDRSNGVVEALFTGRKVRS